ncbi:MAG: pilin [Candidatus Saccharimonadales bacterium]
MRKIKKLTLIFAATLMSAFSVMPMTPAYAAIKDEIGKGACNAAGQVNCTPQAATNSLGNTIKKIVNILSIAAGVIAVIMLIIGGIRYITSAGNEQAVAGAKRTIFYALIGLVIVALAQIIVRFVLKNVT